MPVLTTTDGPISAVQAKTRLPSHDRNLKRIEKSDKVNGSEAVWGSSSNCVNASEARKVYPSVPMQYVKNITIWKERGYGPS